MGCSATSVSCSPDIRPHTCFRTPGKSKIFSDEVHVQVSNYSGCPDNPSSKDPLTFVRLRADCYRRNAYSNECNCLWPCAHILGTCLMGSPSPTFQARPDRRCCSRRRCTTALRSSQQKQALTGTASAPKPRQPPDGVIVTAVTDEAETELQAVKKVQESYAPPSDVSGRDGLSYAAHRTTDGMCSLFCLPLATPARSATPA